jgi:heme-degrading monooxygenase HmoA
MNKMPGFISANIHKSLDGTKALNCAQWENRESFKAIVKNTEAAQHMGEAYEIAESIERLLYEVSFVDEVGRQR